MKFGFKKALFFGLALVSPSVFPGMVFAANLSPEQLLDFSQNNILFYDPTACAENTVYVSKPNGDQITWIGDSYSVGAKSIIESKFPGITFGNSFNNADSSVQSCKFVDSDDGCDNNPNPSGLKVLKGLVDAGKLKPFLVMALGTNGGWSADALNEFKAIMSAANDTVVVFVNSRILNSDYSESNRRLEDFVKANDNYYLADWASVYDASFFANDSVHPNDVGYEKWVNAIYDAFPSNAKSNGSLTGTGDYAKVMSAKNADKSFFNRAGDVPSANWNDIDTGSMKTLLETYGDLAYQLGEAVGAPWIAILVQMRYEDPNSVCGKNNFWGNGCPPGTGAGGASIQGSNLGEGFVQYGKTLTNGYHDQALGIVDPKEYLMAIGPTWVQGSIDGPGYSSIEGMKRSVDALTTFVESVEGQAIVKTFGNYHGTSGSNQCRCTDRVLKIGKWDSGWLVDNSVSGIVREDVNGKDDLDESTNKMYGYYTENGRPNKILLHSTGGTTNGYAAYPAGNKFPAHFTIDLKKRQGYQHFSIYQPALAVKDYDTAGPIQIEIVGQDSGNTAYTLYNFTEEEWDYLAEVLLAISEETGIPLTSTVDWSGGDVRLSESDFTNYEGVLGHMHVPANTHNDPGNIWQYIDAAIQRKGGYDSGCFAGGNGDINATAIKLAWPLNEYGQHAWNEPNPEYAKALREVGMTSYGDSCVEAGGSCDAFVATVMRYSGADPDFYCCGVSPGFMLSYLLTSGKYVETQNGLGNLKPGDIRIGEHHIELYVEVNGEPRIASASYCDRNGDISNYYDNDFRVFRLK